MLVPQEPGGGPEGRGPGPPTSEHQQTGAHTSEGAPWADSGRVEDLGNWNQLFLKPIAAAE